jgi:hypothetical protein
MYPGIILALHYRVLYVCSSAFLVCTQGYADVDSRLDEGSYVDIIYYSLQATRI